MAQTVSALRNALDLTSGSAGHHGSHAPAQAGHESQPAFDLAQHWQIPILKASALNHEGIDDVLAALDRHAEYLAESGEAERRRIRRIEADIQARLREALLKHALQRIPHDVYRRLLAASVQRDIHPSQAVESLLQTLDS